MRSDPLCQGLPSLLEDAASRLPVNALALVRLDGEAHATLTCANALGVTAYRVRTTDLPAEVRPGITAPGGLALADLEANADGPFESRLRLTGYADAIRQAHASRAVAAFQLPDSETPCVAVLGLREDEPLGNERRMDVGSIAGRLADLMEVAAAPDTQLARLQRLEAAHDGLPALFRALDVRDIFDRLSEITRDVLPHDMVVLGVMSDDFRRVHVYAQTSDSRFPETTDNPWPPSQLAGWLYVVIDDLAKHPLESETRWAAMGIRSSIRVAVPFDDDGLAVLNFSSRKVAGYGSNDVVIALLIADYVGIAMSHQRLAEKLTESRQQGKVLARKVDDATSRAAELERRVRALTDELNARSGYHRVIGESPGWRQALTQATKVGSTDTTVLLLGESGTGKEVVARFVHRASDRARGPFVALNCAALPEHLLEAELFGYERGAFTGATQSKPGQLEQAAGGTLFLDEVAEMSPSAQAKFLRVLQEREFQRLGGTRVLKADTRIVAATNRDLEAAIERGQFREDLYYRLNVFAIHLPPLRDRREDIVPLSEAFLADLASTLGRPPGGISQDARRALAEYHWPGNVRELRNILERAAILADGGLIVAEHLAFRTLPAKARAASATAPASQVANAGGDDLKAVERDLIEKAMLDARFNKSQAAKRLGVTRAQLYAKLRRHGLG
jgi:transcriptional regulator with GAF, ATPase, and Fis domain